MEIRIVNLWKNNNEFFTLPILAISKVDCQVAIVIFGFSFIFESVYIF